MTTHFAESAVWDYILPGIRAASFPKPGTIDDHVVHLRSMPFLQARSANLMHGNSLQTTQNKSQDLSSQVQVLRRFVRVTVPRLCSK